MNIDAFPLTRSQMRLQLRSFSAAALGLLVALNESKLPQFHTIPQLQNMSLLPSYPPVAGDGFCSTPSRRRSDLPGVTQVRAVLQTLAPQGPGLRGLDVDLTDVRLRLESPGRGSRYAGTQAAGRRAREAAAQKREGGRRLLGRAGRGRIMTRAGCLSSLG